MGDTLPTLPHPRKRKAPETSCHSRAPPSCSGHLQSLLQWGILATGNIARAFDQGLGYSRTGKLVAVGSRTKTSAEAFGREFDLPSEACHGSYEDLLSDPAVQAIYISNPHPGHAEWAIRCAEAGKHILCEKPLAMNHAEAMAVVEAAQRHDVFLMEAFM